MDKGLKYIITCNERSSRYLFPSRRDSATVIIPQIERFIKEYLIVASTVFVEP